MDAQITAFAKWQAANPVTWAFLSLLLLTLAGTIYNWVMWQRSEQEWAELQKNHPRQAKFIRFMRAVFPHLRKIPAIALWLPAEQPAPEASKPALEPSPTKPDGQ